MERVGFSSKPFCIRSFFLATLLLGQAVFAVTLHDLQGSRRIIVAFGENGDVGVERFLELVREKSCELNERDTDVYLITSQGIDSVTAEAASLDAESVASVLELRHPTETGFALVLIGKDGGIKGRADSADGLTDFLAMIDGMPMRQREIEERGENC